jgi:hypothetical protein
MRIVTDAILVNAATLPGKTSEISHGDQGLYLQFTKVISGTVYFVNMKRNLYTSSTVLRKYCHSQRQETPDLVSHSLTTESGLASPGA